MIDNPICNEYQRCVSPAGLHVQDEEKSNQQAALVSSPDACADLGGVIALHASWLSLPQFETSFLKPRSSLFSNRIELPVTRRNLSSVRTGEEEEGHVAPERHKREVVMKDRKGGMDARSCKAGLRRTDAWRRAQYWHPLGPPGVAQVRITPWDT